MNVRPYSEHWPSKRRLFDEAAPIPSMGVLPMLDVSVIAQAMAQAETFFVSFGVALRECITAGMAAGLFPPPVQRGHSPRRAARRAHRRTLKRGRR